MGELKTLATIANIKLCLFQSDMICPFQTHDDDVISKTLYKIIDGDMTTFGVDGETGELKTLASVAKSRKKQFVLTVMALDQDIPTLNDTISLKVELNSQSCEPGPEVIKLFSCSSQLSIKFKLLIYTKIAQNIFKLKV